MAPKKKNENSIKRDIDPKVKGLRGSITEEEITHTLEYNYMPYAMSVIVSRAIPEIDGFKPSHRKLLWTMYKMGLLNGGKVKSANIVGQTMQYNPHGDSAIYETMVRLSRGNEALLHPFVDSKGNFGKVYSRDMAYAASRYTEAKLDPICSELFRDIDSDTVDMVDNYDSTKKEPVLLPTTFPNVLVSSNMGIAVGMASNICGFNLQEVCDTTIALIKDPEADLLSTLPAPDFPTGAEILYNPSEMLDIYRTGRGPVKLRSRWRYVKEGNLIEVYEIPYSTSIEAILDEISVLFKAGKLKEISDVRDESGLNGLKLTIDLKRGTDPEKLMQRLFKETSLQDNFGCNFNILIAGSPQVLGVREILQEWIAWRAECVKRRIFFQKEQKAQKLHLLLGLKRILLDIDKAIRIIRETESDAEVIPNLMIGFGIDEVQAEFVAEIKLRNINKEYILKRTEEIDDLTQQIDDLEKTLKSNSRVRSIIVKELENVSKKYGTPRKTGLIYETEQKSEVLKIEIPDYPVTVFLSRQGYIKKITAQSLRMSGEQKYKEGDSLLTSFEASNRTELMLLTNQCQAYRLPLSDLEDGKASLLGDYLPVKLQMNEGEIPQFVVNPGDYSGFLLFCYENGKVSRIPLSAFATKSNRKKLTGAYSDKSTLMSVLHLAEDEQVALYSTEGRAMIFNSAQLEPKATRNSLGVQVLSLKKKYTLEKGCLVSSSGITNISRYRVKTIPATGALLKEEDTGNIQTVLQL